MLRVLARILYWLLLLTGWLWGFDHLLDAHTGVDPERAKVLALILQERWQAVALVSLTSGLAGAYIWEWWRERKFQQRLVKEVQRAAGGEWRETDAGAVVRYIARQSAWGWRKYAAQNYWEAVDNDARAELRRVARSGDVRLSGERPNSNERLKPIPSGYWRRAEVSPLDGAGYGTYASLNNHAERVPGETNLHHLRVSTYDYFCEWPRAGIGLKVSATACVWTKWVWVRITPDMWPFRRYWKHRIDDNVGR